MSRQQGSRRTQIRPRIYLILALVWLSLQAGFASAAAPSFEQFVVELRINEQESRDMLVVLRDAAGGFWMDTADLERLRLNPPPGAMIEYEGKTHVLLNGYSQGRVRFEEPLAMLFLDLPAAAFKPVLLSAPEQSGVAQLAAATGMFLNYQVYGQHVSSKSSGGSFTELGIFSGLGVGTSTLATQHASGSMRATRLDTAFTRDFPQRLQTLTVGDAISDPGSFGAALRFAGIRLEKNFAMRPDLVTAPMLVASGTAVVPSAVDVFVNNQRVFSQRVQPGPFVIDNLPTVTGAGDVRVVVRDPTGREQVLLQPFYSSPSLLAAGLNQYSMSLGKVRENYSLRSFDYGALTGSATWRRGVRDGLTVEGHAEYLQGEAYGAGIEVVARAGSFGVVSVATAAGGGDSTSGWLRSVGFERQSERGSVTLNASWATTGFRRAGETELAGSRQKFRGIAQAGFNMGRFGSAALAFAQQRAQDGSRIRTTSLTHSARAGRQGFVNLSLNRSISDRKSSSVFLTYTQAFGSRGTFSAGAEGGSGVGAIPAEQRVSFAEAVPTGEGHGWRASATRRGNYDAWWQQRFAAADLELQASRNFSQSGQSVQLRGGTSFLDGQLHAARTVDGSFAVVDVGGLADVPVYLENRLVTRTDARGRALLPNLLSYEANQISIEPMDLPLNVAIHAQKMVVRPGFRSGVIAEFPVERIAPAVFRLLLPDNTPVPTGAEVRLNGGTFVVAMDGFTYVTTLDHGVGGMATWPGNRCVFRVDPPPSDDPLPDMGDIVCRAAAGVR